MKIDLTAMMFFLLEECNFSCSSCVREDEPMEPGYKLTYEQFRLCLSDCRRLGTINKTYFSGGETTLWQDGNRDLVDLLLDISKAGINPSFTTNGSLFVDYDKCRNFFQKYINPADMPLRVYHSVDTFHQNFDPKAGRCVSLDNIIAVKNSLPGHKKNLLDISPLAVVSKSRESLLPDEMIQHYETLGVPFTVLPLRPVGKAKFISHLCPNLESDKAEDLGAYYPFRPEQNQNETGKSSYLILIGDNYYTSQPDWHIVAQLGHLP
ncbi:radical SAM protein [Planctomycetota bacterium]